MYPKLKFKINPSKDFNTAKAFAEDAQFDSGENLQWAIFRKYPNLKKYFTENKIKNDSLLKNFIKAKYLKDKNVVEKNVEIYQKNWKMVEDDFFQLADILFLNRKWPKGKYIAYTTIWGMFPRFLEDKTFQIPYKRRNKKYVNVVIAHEMLHFIFYEYFYKKYPKYKKDKFNYFVWHISEIFNELIQNSPAWISVFGLETMGYPEHKKIVKKIAKKYYNKNFLDLEKLVLEILAEVEKI